MQGPAAERNGGFRCTICFDSEGLWGRQYTIVKRPKVRTISSRILAARKARHRSADARQIARHSATRKSVQAKNSCFADASKYRVASHRSAYAYV